MRVSNKATALAAGVLVAAFSHGAQAAPINDTYIGGDYLPWGGDPDVKGDADVFQIFSMDVQKTGVGSNDLTVVIKTNYSDKIGGGTNIGNLGTSLGSLFLGETSKLQYNDGVTPGAGVGPGYATDRFTLDTDRFGYVFDFDGAGANPGAAVAGQAGTASLYKINADGSDVLLSNPTGDTIRDFQAVDILDTSKSLNTAATYDTTTNGTWTVGIGSITFNIVNFFLTTNLAASYSTGMTLAWAMSCANDIDVQRVVFRGNIGEEVPLPAGAALLFSGLLGLGYLGRLKSKASKAAA